MGLGRLLPRHVVLPLAFSNCLAYESNRAVWSVGAHYLLFQIEVLAEVVVVPRLWWSACRVPPEPIMDLLTEVPPEVRVVILLWLGELNNIAAIALGSSDRLVAVAYRALRYLAQPAGTRAGSEFVHEHLESASLEDLLWTIKAARGVQVDISCACACGLGRRTPTPQTNSSAAATAVLRSDSVPRTSALRSGIGEKRCGGVRDPLGQRCLYRVRWLLRPRPG